MMMLEEGLIKKPQMDTVASILRRMTRALTKGGSIGNTRCPYETFNDFVTVCTCLPSPVSVYHEAMLVMLLDSGGARLSSRSSTFMQTPAGAAHVSWERAFSSLMVLLLLVIVVALNLNQPCQPEPVETHPNVPAWHNEAKPVHCHFELWITDWAGLR